MARPPVHECTSPNPDRCLHCALEKTVAEQRAAREADPVWAEHVAEQNREWSA